jgi:hypothetical protein
MLSVLLRADDGTVFRTIQPGETGMEANVEAPSVQTRKDYTSRPGALSRFFRMSRDGWKSKYKDLKATVKGYKNRIADLTKSREQRRIRAERAGEQITTMQKKNMPRTKRRRTCHAPNLGGMSDVGGRQDSQGCADVQNLVPG